MRRQIEVAFTVIGIVAMLSANAVGAEWTDGTVGVTWELAPPSTAAVGEEFDATAAANYDANLPAGTEWEYTTVDITFEWEANPDGSVSAGRQPTGGSGGGEATNRRRTSPTPPPVPRRMTRPCGSART